MKWKFAFSCIPNMIKLMLADGRDYAVRLYVRVSWARQGLSLARSAILHYEDRRQIQLNGRSSVGAFSVVIVTASPNISESPLLTVGNNTYLGDQVNVRATGGIIRIGQDVLIANHVTIVSANHGMEPKKAIITQAWEPGDVSIEDDVWIGAGVVVLPGTTIRRGAVIAAGAVVRGEVPSNMIYGGIPARQIGSRLR